MPNHSALRGTPHKWLDIVALSAAAMPPGSRITCVNYYTAHVSGRVDPGAPARQHAYLRALKTLPDVKIHYGKFMVTEKWSPLVQPPTFRPVTALPPGSAPIVAYVLKTEEKGSDVNLGIHLVRDAFLGRFQTAAVLTNDTDLVEAIRIVKQEAGLPVTLLAPVNRPASSLVAAATNVRHIGPYLGPCQLPNPILVPGRRQVVKPATW